MLVVGYECVKLLGEGTFGAAYLIRHLGQQAVLKVLKDPSNSRALERFQREARMLERHRGNAHVLTILHNGSETASPHIVVEYCEGGSLDSWFAKPTSPPWEVMAIVIGHVCLSLEAIHASPGFHRDIKPANILLTSVFYQGKTQPIAKLGDFGLAREDYQGSATMTANGVGTPAFMPPEVIRGGQWTPSGDVYSLGITAVQLMTRSLDPAKAKDVDAPGWFKMMLHAMTSHDQAKRPTVQQLKDFIRSNMLPPKDPARVDVLPRKVDMAPPKTPPVQAPPDASWGWLAALAAAAGLAAIAASNVNTTDAQGKTRRPNGQFGKGWFS